MSQRIKADDLQKTIMSYLQDYVEDIEEDVVTTTDKITKKAVEELKSTSPRGKGERDKPYHLGWKRQIGISALKNHRYTIKIHNATNYQLTHLLEFSHATRNGGRTKALPHIRQIEEKYSKEYEETITTTLKRRK